MTFTMKEGFSLDEVHLYVGNEILPIDKKGKITIAPGNILMLLRILMAPKHIVILSTVCRVMYT